MPIDRSVPVLDPEGERVEAELQWLRGQRTDGQVRMRLLIPWRDSQADEVVNDIGIALAEGLLRLRVATLIRA
jgi:hypothetical protein